MQSLRGNATHVKDPFKRASQKARKIHDLYLVCCEQSSVLFLALLQLLQRVFQFQPLQVHCVPPVRAVDLEHSGCGPPGASAQLCCEQRQGRLPIGRVHGVQVPGVLKRNK